MNALHLSLLCSAGFAAALLLATALRLWLGLRQIRHVRLHREHVPQAFAGVIGVEAHRKAADYTSARQRQELWHALFSAAVVLAWTLLGGLQLLAGLNAAWFGGGLGAQLLLLAEFGLIGALLDLPWDIWRTFGLESRFGFNRSTPALFAADQLKGLLLGAALMAPLALLVLWLMRLGPLWWLWAWAGFAGFSLAMMVIFPTWIAPLFNHFEPLPDGEVKTRAQALMQRCGFALQGLYVMDGSRRSAHANAYFTGIGSARRVVLFDTLLGQLDAQQIEAVLAHEVGHYKRRHIQQRLLLTLAMSLGGFALLGWLASRSWFYSGLGFEPDLLGSNAAAALILFSLALPVFGVFLTPLGSGWSRRHEFEADAYAAEHSDARALGSALLRMYRDNASTLTPDPWFVRFYYSHPPALQRLARLGLSAAAPATA
ncbi:MAG: M48 family metallopeptidase [Betaproteobacteria bacterium]|nr:M48 family metallopeptidase [Betaproteobacteria bacterium]MDE1956817.1 M48 family metallopeptidase [Betaproteobacteria bacterium]